MTPQEAYEKCIKENCRIEELEEIIFTDIDCSYRYARDIIRGQWERGEEAISKHTRYSFLYARDIIEKPFEKCHSIIFNSEYKYFYINFLKSINYDMSEISEWLL